MTITFRKSLLGCPQWLETYTRQRTNEVVLILGSIRSGWSDRLLQIYDIHETSGTSKHARKLEGTARYGICPEEL